MEVEPQHEYHVVEEGEETLVDINVLLPGVGHPSEIDVRIEPPHTVNVVVPGRYHLQLQLAVPVAPIAASVKFKRKTGKLSMQCWVVSSTDQPADSPDTAAAAATTQQQDQQHAAPLAPSANPAAAAPVADLHNEADVQPQAAAADGVQKPADSPQPRQDTQPLQDQQQQLQRLATDEPATPPATPAAAPAAARAGQQRQHSLLQSAAAAAAADLQQTEAATQPQLDQQPAVLQVETPVPADKGHVQQQQQGEQEHNSAAAATTNAAEADAAWQRLQQQWQEQDRQRQERRQQQELEQQARQQQEDAAAAAEAAAAWERLQQQWRQQDEQRRQRRLQQQQLEQQRQQQAAAEAAEAAAAWQRLQQQWQEQDRQRQQQRQQQQLEQQKEQARQQQQQGTAAAAQSAATWERLQQRWQEEDRQRQQQRQQQQQQHLRQQQVQEGAAAFRVSAVSAAAPLASRQPEAEAAYLAAKVDRAEQQRRRQPVNRVSATASRGGVQAAVMAPQPQPYPAATTASQTSQQQPDAALNHLQAAAGPGLNSSTSSSSEAGGPAGQTMAAGPEPSAGLQKAASSAADAGSSSGIISSSSTIPASHGTTSLRRDDSGVQQQQQQQQQRLPPAPKQQLLAVVPSGPSAAAGGGQPGQQRLQDSQGVQRKSILMPMLRRAGPGGVMAVAQVLLVFRTLLLGETELFYPVQLMGAVYGTESCIRDPTRHVHVLTSLQVLLTGGGWVMLWSLLASAAWLAYSRMLMRHESGSTLQGLLVGSEAAPHHTFWAATVLGVAPVVTRSWLFWLSQWGLGHRVLQAASPALSVAVVLCARCVSAALSAAQHLQGVLVGVLQSSSVAAGPLRVLNPLAGVLAQQLSPAGQLSRLLAWLCGQVVAGVVAVLAWVLPVSLEPLVGQVCAAVGACWQDSCSGLLGPRVSRAAARLGLPHPWWLEVVLHVWLGWMLWRILCSGEVEQLEQQEEGQGREGAGDGSGSRARDQRQRQQQQQQGRRRKAKKGR